MQSKFFISSSNAAAVFFLCFCIPFSLMFYHCLSREYDYNLMLGRGFVSGNSVFFSVYTNGPESEAVISDSGSSDSKGFLNNLQDSSDNIPYLIVSQLGVVRATFYQGDVMLPPIISGRLFSSEESRSDKKLAIIGRFYSDSVWDDRGTRMITLEYGDYEVIGVLGLQQPSTIDELIFINAGSLDEDTMTSGLFYIDSPERSPDTLFKDLSARLSAEGRFSTDEIDMSPTTVDIVSGGIFYSGLLQGIIYAFLFLIFLCTLVFYIQVCKPRAALLLLNGYTYRQTVIRLSVSVLSAGSVGMVFSVVAGIIMALCGFFCLPKEAVIISVLLSSLYALTAMFLFPLSMYFAVRAMNLPESLR